MLSNFVWAKRLIELCFSCFTANNWLDFREAAFFRGNNMLIPDNAMPIGKTQQLANEEIEILPVITAEAINSVPTASEKVAKSLIVLANFSLLENLSEK